MEEYSREKISTFRERFSELCDSSPQNDTAIAHDLNVSRQTICSWKSGARSPKSPTVLTIANYFGVDVAWLMGFDVQKRHMSKLNLQMFSGEEPPETELPKNISENQDIRLLINGLSKMPPEQIRKAKDVMKAVFAEYASYFEEDNHDDA